MQIHLASPLVRSVLGVAALLALGACAYKQRTYPVCNLRCPPGTPQESCAIKEADFAGVRMLVERRGGGRAADVLKVSNAYVVIGSTDSDHDFVRKVWAEFGCYPPLYPLTKASFEAYRRCVELMPKWLEFVDSGPAILLKDASFQATCTAP